MKQSVRLLGAVAHVLTMLLIVQAETYNVKAGSGTIESPNYPHWYPNSQNIEWKIRSQQNTRIRMYVLLLQLEESENCIADSLSVYDGDGVNDASLLGRFCGGEPPPMMQSSSSLVTVRFVSDFQEQDMGFVITYEVVDDLVGSRIIWTEINPDSEMVRLTSLPADPFALMTPEGQIKPTLSTRHYYRVVRGDWGAVATHYGRQEVIWSDRGQKRILRGTIGEGARARPMFGGTSGKVNGIAVDWMTDNVYWTDATYDLILLLSSDGTRFDIVVDDGLDEPGGIAVHPIRGLLFWTDAGVEPKVERSNLAGGNRIKLATEDVVSPRGITVDYETNRVYWVDADPAGNRVEVCHIDGGGRRRLYHTPVNQDFFDLTIFQDYIYVTGRDTQTLNLLTKDTGQLGFSLNLPLAPNGIVTYAPDTQPPSVSHCRSNPCEHLCVGGGPNGFTCLCGSGRLLASNGRTCRDEGAINPPQLFVVSRSKLSHYPSNFPDMVIPADYNVSHMLTSRSHAVALAVDLEDGLVFYSDVVKKSIGVARLRGGSPVKYITGATNSVEGMAVDWLTKLLYWTDNPRGTIEVSRYDGSYRTTLLKDNVLRPRGIAIDPQEKLMFWTEFGPPAQIEKATLDGTEREVIVSAAAGQQLGQFSGLVIDYEEKRVYYGDIASGTINSIDYFGGDRRTVVSKIGASFFELALYKDYIIWTELGVNNGIFVSNRETGQPVRAMAQPEQVYGITMYADTRQKMFHNPCRYNNGGCQQLCLNNHANSRGYVCHCSLGFFLSEDGRSCLSNLLQNDFLLVTDTYRRSIYQVGLTANFIPEALPLSGVKNPIGVTFDPAERKIYWTDVGRGEISRISLDGSDQETIATENIGQPDGIAVDSISRLVYWTDLGERSISVAKMDGSHRKTLVTSLVKPRAIALHPVEGVMFWSDWRSNAVIERSYMDGNMRREIVNENLMWPNGLAIDFAGNRLYWSDGGVDKIESSDFSGHDRRIVIEYGQGFHFFGVAIVDDSIFWTDWKIRSVSRADKLTGNRNATVGPHDYLRPNALYAVTNSSLPSGINSCSDNNGECSTLCLPTAIGRTCACADGDSLTFDDLTCVSEINVECPMDFLYGGVVEQCDRSPGSNCSVICFSGHVPVVDQVTCLDTGFWNLPHRAICREQQCNALPVPVHTIAGPCRPPYEQGKLCVHECEPGYISTGGTGRRICAHGGQWIGTPIVCEEATETVVETGSCSTDLAFVMTPEDISPVVNDLVQEYCSVNSPQVDITWYKDGERLMTGSVDGIYILDSDKSLLIPGFEAHHYGHYACVATFSGRECLRVEVDFILDRYLHFDTIPENATLETGDHHLFECNAVSALDTVTWLKDGAQLAQTEQIIKLAGGSLILRYLIASDSGQYTCVVSDQRGNTRGEAHAWLHVSEADLFIPSINITEVCGTVTATDAIGVTTPAPFNPRVVGGTTALRGSAPYMGRVWHKSERSFICGATLLNQEWVLTATHCITLHNLQIDDILIHFGDHDSLSTEDSEEKAEVAEIVQHEDFNDVSFDRDIALIRLKQPFAEFTDFIRPICIPPAWLAKQLLTAERMGRVTGWGRIAEGGPYPRYLTEVYLPVVKTKKCKQGTTYEVTKNMFCAGYSRVERDACQGDSGGPFAMIHENRWYQMGIVSWGEGCAREGKYGYYTKILKFVTWINRHISQ